MKVYDTRSVVGKVTRGITRRSKEWNGFKSLYMCIGMCLHILFSIGKHTRTQSTIQNLYIDIKYIIQVKMVFSACTYLDISISRYMHLIQANVWFCLLPHTHFLLCLFSTDWVNWHHLPVKLCVRRSFIDLKFISFCVYFSLSLHFTISLIFSVKFHKSYYTSLFKHIMQKIFCWIDFIFPLHSVLYFGAGKVFATLFLPNFSCNRIKYWQFCII